MPGDYIPATDADFANWTTNFTSTLASVYASVGVTVDQYNAEQVLQTAWDTAYGLIIVPATLTPPNVAAKVTARVNLQAAIRLLVKNIQACATTTDDLRAQLGITIRDPKPTKIVAPVTKPVLSLANTASLEATLRVVDEATPTSRAKPFGAVACQVYSKIGGNAPASIADCNFEGIMTKPLQTLDFTSAAAGQIVWLLGQWQTRTGLTGPTSDVLSVTIPH